MEQQKKKKGRTEEQVERHRAWMREYLKNQPTISCNMCSGKYQPTNKHHHVRSQKHLNALEKKEIKDSNLILINELQDKVDILEDLITSFHTIQSFISEENYTRQNELKREKPLNKINTINDVFYTESEYDYDSDKEASLTTEQDTMDLEEVDLESLLGASEFNSMFEGSELNYII